MLGLFGYGVLGAQSRRNDRRIIIVIFVFS